jgi:hypothetical protein
VGDISPTGVKTYLVFTPPFFSSVKRVFTPRDERRGERSSLGVKVYPSGSNITPGANPTIGIYNASVVNFYKATGSLARFENKNI